MFKVARIKMGVAAAAILGLSIMTVINPSLEKVGACLIGILGWIYMASESMMHEALRHLLTETNASLQHFRDRVDVLNDSKNVQNRVINNLRAEIQALENDLSRVRAALAQPPGAVRDTGWPAPNPGLASSRIAASRPVPPPSSEHLRKQAAQHTQSDSDGDLSLLGMAMLATAYSGNSSSDSDGSPSSGGGDSGGSDSSSD